MAVPEWSMHVVPPTRVELTDTNSEKRERSFVHSEPSAIFGALFAALLLPITCIIMYTGFGPLWSRAASLLLQ